MSEEIKDVKFYEQANPRKGVLFLDGERFMQGCHIVSIEPLERDYIDITTPECRTAKAKLIDTTPVKVKICYEYRGHTKHTGSKIIEVAYGASMTMPIPEEIDGNIDNEPIQCIGIPSS